MCFKKEVLECRNYSVRHCVTPSIFFVYDAFLFLRFGKTKCLSSDDRLWQSCSSSYICMQKSLPRVCGEKKTHECANAGNGMNKKKNLVSRTLHTGLDRLSKQTFDFLLATAAFSLYAKTLSLCRRRQAAIKHPFLFPVFLSPLWEEGWRRS